MPLHPFVVHFVVACFPASVLLDILGWLTRKEKFHFAAWINLILAAIAVVLALFSGLWEKNHINLSPEAIHFFEIHETLAFLSIGIIISLFLWRVGMKGKVKEKFKILYLIISMSGFVTVLSGAFYGGELVYRHGIGHRPDIITAEPDRGKNNQDQLQSPDNLFYPAQDSIP